MTNRLASPIRFTPQFEAEANTGGHIAAPITFASTITIYATSAKLDAPIVVESHIGAYQTDSNLGGTIIFHSGISAVHSCVGALQSSVSFNDPHFLATNAKGGILNTPVPVSFQGTGEHTIGAVLGNEIFFVSDAPAIHAISIQLQAPVVFHDDALADFDTRPFGVISAPIAFNSTAVGLRGVATTKARPAIRFNSNSAGRVGNNVTMAAQVTFAPVARAAPITKGQISSRQITFSHQFVGQHAKAGIANARISFTPTIRAAVTVRGQLSANVPITSQLVGYDISARLSNMVEFGFVGSASRGATGALAKPITFSSNGSVYAPARLATFNRSVVFQPSIIGLVKTTGRLSSSVLFSSTALATEGARLTVLAQPEFTSQIVVAMGVSASLAAPVIVVSSLLIPQLVTATAANDIVFGIHGFSLNTSQYPDYFPIISVA